MPRVTIAPENRAGSAVEKFPALKLASTERARIACLDTEEVPQPGGGSRRVVAPWFEWVHSLRAPKTLNGEALRVKRVVKGDEIYEWDLDFFGNPICLGSKEALTSKGEDPENCPVCQAIREHADVLAGARASAVIRYAMNVVKYSTRPGGWELVAPFSASVLVWAFTEKRFNRLDDLQRKLVDEVVADGRGGTRPKNLTDVDVCLGPCEDASWQKYEIDTAGGFAAWRSSEETAAAIRQLWTGEGNRATDEQLEAACGRRPVNRAYLAEDISKTVAAWRTALRAGPAVADPFGAEFSGQRGRQDMTAGMGDLLNSAPAAQPAPAFSGALTQAELGAFPSAQPQVPQPQVPAVPPPAPATALAAQPAAQAVPPAGAAPPAPASDDLFATPPSPQAAAPGVTQSFDDLLNF